MELCSKGTLVKLDLLLPCAKPDELGVLDIEVQPP